MFAFLILCRRCIKGLVQLNYESHNILIRKTATLSTAFRNHPPHQSECNLSEKGGPGREGGWAGERGGGGGVQFAYLTMY